MSKHYSHFIGIICYVEILFFLKIFKSRRILFRMLKHAEPLLTDNPRRYVMFPLQDDDIWRLYKKMFDCMWRAEEIDLSKDLKH